MTVVLIISVFFLALGSRSVAQNKETMSKRTNVYVSRAGFKVQYQGTLIKHSSDEYVIKLPSSADKQGSQAYARIFVSDRPFVYLPGTYGGKLYLDSLASDRVLKDRVYTDTVEIDSMRFMREYWIIYAGMGAWECVVNCYARQKDCYYIISLSIDQSAGKPGQLIDGRQLTSEEFRASLLKSLQDTTTDPVRQFNRLIESFQTVCYPTGETK